MDRGGVRVRFSRGDHPVPCYAMRFEKDGKSLVYTADTMYSKEIVSFAKGADVLLAEATLQDEDSGLESMGHMTARRASKLAGDAGVGRLVLTHLWPGYDPQKSLEEAKTGFKDVLLARTGMTVSI